MKIKVGIIFGGRSREREVSFAGGRTVYDNLNKSIFEPVPIFIDSFGNFVLLNWQHIYKGSIRDFYPPIDNVPITPHEFQIYAESLGNLNDEEQEKLINKIGKRIKIEDLLSHIDFAFLCLHGPYGEDGRIQGLFEYLGLPYSGSGILSSAIGIDKSRQMVMMENIGFDSPPKAIITYRDWVSHEEKDRKEFYKFITEEEEFEFPLVIKPATQGSSLGVTILKKAGYEGFKKALNKAFFTYELSMEEWFNKDETEKIDFIKNISDIREGIGMPVILWSDDVDRHKVYHPNELLDYLNYYYQKYHSDLVLRGEDTDSYVLIEEFIEGKEFSCIVIEDHLGNGEPFALPPTEIIKGKALYDYRSKYLPGLSRKITPIDASDDELNNIIVDCEQLFIEFFFDVYARIDGFLSDDGTIYLNDPNTTSGMLPSSFFFHQAAEIGLNPSQFLTYIILTSIQKRILDFKNYNSLFALWGYVDNEIKKIEQEKSNKIKIAVILGGYSSERHISVESGRNVYEKLSSSEKYEPIPIFLMGDENKFELYKIPINILLKDNADDIREKIKNYEVHPVVEEIKGRCKGITETFANKSNLEPPKKISFKQLAEMVDGIFIALHGRPGEDGTIQKELEKVGLPYNGSNPDVSQITINKYQTNEILMQNGFSVAKHSLVYQKDWEKDSGKMLKEITKQFSFPFIAKPVDDGCSSAVKMIKNDAELKAYSEMIFRKEEKLITANLKILNLQPNEEFPRKDVFLVEELITANGAKHFLEITGGLLTHFKNNKTEFEIFEASEALSVGDVLSLEEKFLAGEGQNITPARYASNPNERKAISDKVRAVFLKAAKLLNLEGYARIDAFVRIFDEDKIEVVFIEVNSLPGMTPATCIFHQAAINGYKPYEFIDEILDYGFKKAASLQNQVQ